MLLTTASCSFSSCIWSSAAVSGRGCRSGPGPGPTPVLSWPATGAAGGKPGEARAEEDEAIGLMVGWFDGRMFEADAIGAGGGGMAVYEDGCWRLAARARGDGGTLLRSGISTRRGWMFMPPWSLGVSVRLRAAANWVARCSVYRR